MSPREQHLVARIGWLKSREQLLIKCCRDYEQDIERLLAEIDRLLRQEEGRATVPPLPVGGSYAA
jgi:hypothetical protein